MSCFMRCVPLLQIAAVLALSISTAFAAKPPTISGVGATTLNSQGAVIVWTTSVPASGQVEYGTTTKYGSTTPVDNTLVGSHAVPLAGLAPNTSYHYRVKSSPSPSTGATVSSDFTFKTLALPPLGYSLQFFDTPVAGNAVYIYGMNYHGHVTGASYIGVPYQGGDYFGFLYVPGSSTAIDLQAVYGAPAGWRISAAWKINNNGVLVGTLVPEGQKGNTPFMQGFVLDTLADVPTVIMLPNWVAGTRIVRGTSTTTATSAAFIRTATVCFISGLSM